MFETGVKVIDLIQPFLKGGKIGLFGGAGVGKTVVIMELINNVPSSTEGSPCSPEWVSAREKATSLAGDDRVGSNQTRQADESKAH